MTSASTYAYGIDYNPVMGVVTRARGRKKVVQGFLSVDPLTGYYPMLTPYQFASNSPIQSIDLDGLEAQKVTGIDGNEGTVNGPYLDAQASADNGSANVTYDLPEAVVSSGSSSFDDLYPSIPTIQQRYFPDPNPDPEMEEIPFPLRGLLYPNYHPQNEVRGLGASATVGIFGKGGTATIGLVVDRTRRHSIYFEYGKITEGGDISAGLVTWQNKSIDGSPIFNRDLAGEGQTDAGGLLFSDYFQGKNKEGTISSEGYGISNGVPFGATRSKTRTIIWPTYE